MRKGFTLVEVLVSFAILALVVGVSAAFLRASGPSMTLRSASRDIASDLRHASELASATQIGHVVRFNIAEFKTCTWMIGIIKNIKINNMPTNNLIVNYKRE